MNRNKKLFFLSTFVIDRLIFLTIYFFKFDVSLPLVTEKLPQKTGDVIANVAYELLNTKISRRLPYMLVLPPGLD